MRSEVNFIIVNDTLKPRTGGDYVYSVMKDELFKQGYKINEVSLPRLLRKKNHSSVSGWIGQSSLSYSEVMAYVRCYLASLKKYGRHPPVVVTSSCPTFPVLGHITYHQPKAGIFTRSRKEGESIRRMVGYKVEVNERFSPLWFFAKKLMRLHPSNSKFTRELVERMYKVDSHVLYPPIPTERYRPARHGARKRYLLLTRPEATTGIAFLSNVAPRLPKDITLVLIGNIDRTGIRALKDLKSLGTKCEYLGFVDEKLKIDLFQKCSVYVNLARNETFGMSVVEALASGCIPIAHQSGAIPEYLPSEFCYSDFDQIPEKVANYIDARKDVREKLSDIAARFDEAIFRRRFMVFFRGLESLLNISDQGILDRPSV